VYQAIVDAWAAHQKEATVSPNGVWKLVEKLADIWCMKCRIMADRREDHTHTRLFKSIYRKNRGSLVNMKKIDEYILDKIEEEEVCALLLSYQPILCSRKNSLSESMLCNHNAACLIPRNQNCMSVHNLGTM
jgi:hypothetical protein